MNRISKFFKSLFSSKEDKAEGKIELINDGSFNDAWFPQDTTCKADDCCGGDCHTEAEVEAKVEESKPKRKKAPAKKKAEPKEAVKKAPVKKAPAKKKAATTKKDKE